MTTIWDPLRKKQVAHTPEEQVRQWFIRVLNEDMGVPMHMMMSEVPVRLGQKDFRADIVVYGRDLKPVAVVECKRPEVELSGEVLEQAIRYDMTLEVRYIFITNGRRTYTHGPEGFTAAVPSYGDMTR